MLLIIEILRLVHGLAQQAPKATTHVRGLGVADHDDYDNHDDHQAPKAKTHVEGSEGSD